MKLFLMRHGEAEPYRTDDMNRQLTPTGRASVASKSHLFPTIDLLIVSPYLRALQTADILVGEGVQVTRRVMDERVVPESDLEPIVDDLLAEPVETRLIVAHNPLLSRLLRHLSGAQARGVSMDTANVALLEAEAFLPGTAQLLWIK